MAIAYNEGFKPILDHVDVRNRESVAAWEERMWQRQLRSEFVDPRDEQGRQFFRRHMAAVGELRHMARRLQEAKANAERREPHE